MFVRRNPDLLALIGWVAGWSLVTAGLILALGPWWIALLSAGVFILGCVGLRPLVLFLWIGQYGAFLSTEEERKPPEQDKAE